METKGQENAFDAVLVWIDWSVFRVFQKRIWELTEPILWIQLVAERSPFR